MKIFFWNDKSDNIIIGESYFISSFVVRSFEGGFVLNIIIDIICKFIFFIKIVYDVKVLFDEKMYNVYI